MAFGRLESIVVADNPLVRLFLGSLSWSVWHYQLTSQQCCRSATAEQAAIKEASEAKLATKRRKLKKARDAKNDERVQQLYREIDSLTRIHEQILLPRQTAKSTPLKMDDLQPIRSSP